MNFLKTGCLLKIIGSGDGSAGKQMQQQCEDWTSLWNPLGSPTAIPVFWSQRWRTTDKLAGYTGCVSELRDQVRDSTSICKVESD